MKTNRLQVFRNPEFFLRLGLGLTYLYSSMGLLRNPVDWSGFAPIWLIDLVEKFVSIEVFFRMQGVLELLLALTLLAWFASRKFVFIASIVGSIHVLLVILLAGVNPITFRDIGLLGAWLALASMYKQELP